MSGAWAADKPDVLTVEGLGQLDVLTVESLGSLTCLPLRAWAA